MLSKGKIITRLSFAQFLDSFSLIISIMIYILILFLSIFLVWVKDASNEFLLVPQIKALLIKSRIIQFPVCMVTSRQIHP